MYVKKRMSLLLFAALAMVLFTACGRWDFSREAAKAANEAQNAVVFETSTTLAQSLKDALEDKVQTADVKAAMEADERLDDLLGRLDVYAVESDDAEAAAQTIADGYIKHISGRKSDGHIAMVKADNGYFYEAVLTYRHSSSGGSSGGASGGDNDPDTPVVPDEPESFTVTAEVTSSYSGKAGISPSEVSNLSKGSDVNFTVSRSFFDELASVKINGEEIFDTDSPNEDLFDVAYNNNFTYSFTLKNVQADTNIEVEFEEAEAVINQLYITEGKNKYALGETISEEGMKLHGPLNNSNKWGDTGDDITIDLEVNRDVTITPETMGIDTEVVTVHYKGQIGSVDVECDIEYSVTLIPTVSDYGESKYLSKEDFDTLVKSFNYAVETLGKEVSSGADDPIQQAMNEATSGPNIGSVLGQLKDGGNITSYRHLATVTEENAIDLQKSVNDKLVSFYGERYASTLKNHIYMTIKDGANGQIECYIYTVDVVE